MEQTYVINLKKERNLAEQFAHPTMILSLRCCISCWTDQDEPRKLDSGLIDVLTFPGLSYLHEEMYPIPANLGHCSRQITISVIREQPTLTLPYLRPKQSTCALAKVILGLPAPRAKSNLSVFSFYIFCQFHSRAVHKQRGLVVSFSLTYELSTCPNSSRMHPVLRLSTPNGLRVVCGTSCIITESMYVGYFPCWFWTSKKIDFTRLTIICYSSVLPL
jgi:hypothetical protein